jgi:putative transposase
MPNDWPRGEIVARPGQKEAQCCHGIGVAELADRGLKVDYRTVWKVVHATGCSFKKSRNSRWSRTAPT